MLVLIIATASKIQADWVAFLLTAAPTFTIDRLQTAGAESSILGISGLGVGGALALIVLQWKRADDVKHAADMKEQAAETERLANKYIELVERFMAGQAMIASALEAIKTAIQQRESENELEKRLEQIMARLDGQTAGANTANQPRRNK